MRFYICSPLGGSTIVKIQHFFNLCILVFLFQNWTLFFTGQFRLAGIPGGLWSNVLPKAGSAVGSHQVAQGFSSTLENVQGQTHHKDRDITTSLDNGENVFPYIQFESLSQFLPGVSCRPATHHCEESGSIFLVTSSHVLGGLQAPHHPPELPLPPD